MSIRKGESIDLDAVYWQRNCESILLHFDGVQLMEGPPGLSLLIRQEPVWARHRNCRNHLYGGTVVLTATNVTEKFEGTIHYRVTYSTKEGNKQSNHSKKVIVYP